MKRLLLIVLPLLLIVGCSKPINEDHLIEQNGLKFHPGKGLYSGETFSLNKDGSIRYERSYKDGIKLSTTEYSYFKNGQVYQKSYFIEKNGEKDGLVTNWDTKGNKRMERKYKDGSFVSQKIFNEHIPYKEP
jgi:antitoxin component YwqK of YwqJK toxin-antitoxin module